MTNPWWGPYRKKIIRKVHQTGENDPAYKLRNFGHATRCLRFGLEPCTSSHRVVCPLGGCVHQIIAHGNIRDQEDVRQRGI